MAAIGGAGGGAGGRTYPVYIDLITRNAQKAIGDLNKLSAAATNLNKGTIATIAPLNRSQQAMQKTSQQSTLLAHGFQNVGGASQRATGPLSTVQKASQNTGKQMQITSSQFTTAGGATQKFSATLAPVGSSFVSANRGAMPLVASLQNVGTESAAAGQGTQELTKHTGRAGAAFGAFRNSGRGAQFALIGLSGSINEAIFMTQSLMNAQDKVSEAQDRVNELQAKGQQHTAEYTRAVNDLQDAQRGANFTFRIFMQSWLDNITFGGMLLSQLPKVINEYRRLRAVSAAAGTTLAANSGILSRLRGLFSRIISPLTSVNTTLQATGAAANTAGTGITTLASRTQPVAGALSTAAISADKFRASAANVATATASTSAALGNMSRSAVPLATAFGGVANSTGVLSGALARIPPVAGAAAAATLPLATGMKLVDTTSKSIVPSVGGANAALAAIPPTATLGAGALATLTGAMRTFGHASMAFVMHPIGMILIAAAAVITLIVGLRENWFGLNDAAWASVDSHRAIAEELRNVGDAHTQALIPAEEAAGLYEAEAKSNEQLLNVIGATSPALRASEAAQKDMNDTIAELMPRIREATAALLGYNQGWQDVVENGEQLAKRLGGSYIQLRDDIVTQIMDLRRVLKEEGPNKAIQEELTGFEQMQTRLSGTFSDIQGILNLNVGLWDEKWTQFGAIATREMQVIEALPSHIAEPIQNMVDVLDEAFEAEAISATQWGNILQAVVNEQVIPSFSQLTPEIQAAIAPVEDLIVRQRELVESSGGLTQATNGVINSEAELINIKLALIQASAKAKAEAIESAQATEEEKTALEESIAVTQQKINAIKLSTVVTAQNIDFAKEQIETYQNLTTTFSQSSQEMLEVNQRALDVLMRSTQAFDVHAVSVQAAAEGRAEWVDIQAKSTAEIINSATALGFEGEVIHGVTVEMLEHIAVTEKQNEVNEAAVEGYFSLSEGQKATIDSSGELAQRLVDVAIRAEDVTLADAALIAEQVKLNEENEAAVETWLKLDDAQRLALESLGITPEIMQQVRDGHVTLTQAMINAIETQGKITEETDKHKEAIEALSPQLQQYAANLELVGLKADEVGPVQQALTQHTIDLGSAFDSTIQDTINFITEQGKVGDIVGMTIPQLLEYIATMDLTGATMKTAAEEAQEAAKALADTWEAELQRAVQAWTTTSDQLKSAAEDIGDDIGDAGAEAATKFTDEFLGKFVPAQLVEEAFDKNIDIEDVIDDIQDEAEDALDDGLISEMTMDQAIQPMIDALEEIPGENEKAMGEAIAIWRHYSQNLRPILVGGIHEVGREAITAFETGLFEPIQAQLEAGAGSGIWLPLITSFKDVVNALPPEYNRMKGDFLKMLELTKGNTRAQINAILPILREINPEWAAIIEEMDTDADGIKDIFDNKISSPAEQMRESLITTFADIFEAWALVVPEFAGAAEHLRGLLTETQDAASATAGLTGEWLELAKTFGMSAGEVNNLRANFDGYNTATGDGVTLSEDFKEGLEKMNPETRQAAIDLAEAWLKADLFADGVETAGNNSVTATGEIGGLGVGLEGVASNAGAAAQAVADFAQVLSSHDFSKGPLAVPDLLQGREPTSQKGYGSTEEEEARQTGGGAAAEVQTPDFGAALDKWRTYASDVNTILQGITTSVQAHSDAMTQHIAFHQQQVGAQVNLTGQHLTRLVQGYGLTLVGVQTAMSQMAVLWVGHAAMVGSQVNTTGQHLIRLVTGYGLVMTGVLTAMTDMSLYWVQHGQSITATYNSMIVPTINAYSVTAMGAAAANVFLFLSTMNQNWNQHGTAVQTVVTSTIAGAITTYASYLSGTESTVLTHTTNMSVHWHSHGQSVTVAIGSTISAAMGSYAGMLQAMESNVHAATHGASLHWNSHANTVAAAANSASQSASDLASDVEDAMSDIVTAMGQAEQAARDLQTAIDALQSKTIEVRTNYTTSGAAPTATGMNQTVGGSRGPMLILAGEAGPEHVKITPLQGASTTHDGIAPLAGGMVAAAKGMDAIVRPLDDKHVAEFVGQRGHRIREIIDEMEDEGQMVIRVERAYKRVPKMTKDEWKDYAKEIGWKVDDFDKKNYGFEVDLKPKKGARVLAADLDEPEGFQGGVVDADGHFRRGNEDFDGGGGAFRAQQAGRTFQRPGARTAGGAGGGTITAGGGGGGGITKVNFAGPVTVYTSVNLSLEIDRQKFGRLTREVVAEGYAQTK